MGAIKREMNNAKWTWFAIGYQCLFAYVIGLIIYQVGLIFTGGVQIVGLIVAIAFIGLILYMLFRPYRESNQLTEKAEVTCYPGSQKTAAPSVCWFCCFWSSAES